ncbi:energy-coupling factor transporter ATPase [Bacillus sp. FJAT-49732]|uniref:Energy-coupling factor transporter ATP-binding protein EcfA2 n=1 Tax=Lederbergia citrisecunda TaxID=2833583 RepID=A0A942TNU8_9BACI|nr:energy-coupling factor transporter ATPase [Lederbergia citrisecunda]MBS4199387.1 energy-coupling factor transporter ATPase [Lederbergia citrisecunda]
MEIIFDNVSADFQIGPIRSPLVLHSVHLKIKTGTFTAVVGHTGAGKSSLLKAMNGLLIPKEGKVLVGKKIIDSRRNKKDIKVIRQKVGMVFQFPESQLFAETVEKDICFGPVNFGVPEKLAKEIARNVIKMVGLDNDILFKSPFSLSGGQKRRVAIAGVLAMEPDILILDEPGAGLDPQGKKDILTLLKNWNQDRGMTIVLVTHDMNDVALYADDVIIMEKGRVAAHTETRTLFSNNELLNQYSLDVPDVRRLQMKIEKEIGLTFPHVCLSVEDLAEALIEGGVV